MAPATALTSRMCSVTRPSPAVCFETATLQQGQARNPGQARTIIHRPRPSPFPRPLGQPEHVIPARQRNVAPVPVFSQPISHCTSTEYRACPLPVNTVYVCPVARLSCPPPCPCPPCQPVIAFAPVQSPPLVSPSRQSELLPYSTSVAPPSPRFGSRRFPFSVVLSYPFS